MSEVVRYDASGLSLPACVIALRRRLEYTSNELAKLREAGPPLAVSFLAAFLVGLLLF
jgi:hypothetical protein